MDVRLKKNLFVLMFFALVPACTWFGGTTSITIGCDEDELIDTINTANASSDDYIITLAVDCEYILDTPDNSYGGLGDNGLPVITNWIKFIGNNASIKRLEVLPAGTIPDFRLFYVTDTGRLTLENITLTNGGGPRGGAVYNDGGTLTARDAFFKRNMVNERGGAIYNKGTVVIENDSLLEQNRARDGGAIYNYGGTVTVRDSTFHLNVADSMGSTFGGSGGAIVSRLSDGLVILEGVTFQDNIGTSGGACSSIYGGVFEITNSAFIGNSATGGGAIWVSPHGIVTITDSLFEENTSMLAGGAIYIDVGAEVTVINSIFEGNETNYLNLLKDGGAIRNFGELEIWNSTFHANIAGRNGGGISNGGLLTLYNSTLYENTAGVYGGGLFSFGPTIIVNSTFSANEAGNAGGGMYAGKDPTWGSDPLIPEGNQHVWLTNNTFAFNTAPSGAGIYISIEALVGVRNNIVANNLSGSDCVQAGGTVTLQGENLDTDNSCPVFSLMADPMLAGLADNGGNTLTHELLMGSPAIDAVTTCSEMPTGGPLNEDQRGAARPFGPACDLGAYESTPISFSITTPTPPVYWCEDILGITILEGGMMRIQLSTPGLPAGTYNAIVGRYDFICQTYDEYPDRLFCDGPKGEGGTLTTLTIFDPSGILICEESFSIPARDVPDKPDEPQGCHPGLSHTACTEAGGIWTVITNAPSCNCP